MLEEQNIFREKCKAFIDANEDKIFDTGKLSASLYFDPPYKDEWTQVEKDVMNGKYASAENIKEQYLASCRGAHVPCNVTLRSAYMVAVLQYIEDVHYVKIEHIEDLSGKRSVEAIGAIAVDCLETFARKDSLKHGIFLNIIMHYCDFKLADCKQCIDRIDLFHLPQVCQFDESRDIGLKCDLSSAIAVLIHCASKYDYHALWKHFE